MYLCVCEVCVYDRREWCVIETKERRVGEIWIGVVVEMQVGCESGVNGGMVMVTIGIFGDMV